MPNPRRFSVFNPGQKISHQRIEDEAALEDVYKMGDILGRGSFGVVVSGVNLKTGKRVAIKQVNKEKAGSADVKLLEREVAILKKVNHPQIIQLQEILETSKKMFLVMELCEFGDLKTLLFSKGPFSEESSRFLIKSLANVVAYLHKNGIVHRDLKLDNILIASCTRSESGEPLYDIRVTDFGLSVVKDATDHMLQAACGTPVYMAPEVIRNHDYSQQCDNWSIGVILFALLSREFPFSGETEERLFDAIKRGEIHFSGSCWVNKSESVKNLIKNILVVDPAHRYTANEIASHPWTMGSTDANTSMPTNVLAMMKDFAKKMADDGVDYDDEEASGLFQDSTQASLRASKQALNKNVSPISKEPVDSNFKKASGLSLGKSHLTKKPPLSIHQRKESSKSFPNAPAKIAYRPPVQSAKSRDHQVSSLPKQDSPQRRLKDPLSGRPNTGSNSPFNPSGRPSSGFPFREADTSSPARIKRDNKDPFSGVAKSNFAAGNPKH